MNKLDSYIDMLESYLDLNIDDFLGLNRFAIKNILELLKENKELENRIHKALHLVHHNDIMDYRIFEQNLKDILRGRDINV